MPPCDHGDRRNPRLPAFSARSLRSAKLLAGRPEAVAYMTPDCEWRVVRGDGWQQWKDYWRPGEQLHFWESLRHALQLPPAKTRRDDQEKVCTVFAVLNDDGNRRARSRLTR